PYASTILSSIGVALAFGWLLQAYYERIPTRNAISKSILLSMVFLLILDLLFASTTSSDPIGFFTVAYLLDAPEFLVFGLVLGYVYCKLMRGTDRREGHDLLSERQS
ncbi:MAG: hypothetical protein ACREBQ_13435, partial [Nitrososphaerales archaeon]